MNHSVDKKSYIGLICAATFLLLPAILPVTEGVTREGLYSLGIFFGAIALWICETVPMCVAAFAIMFIMPYFHVMDINTVYSSFGGSAFFFAIATFAVSIALENTSIPLRICHALTKWSKGNSKRLVIALYFACAITSSIMSNLSTCIIYLGLVLALLKANNCTPGKSNLGKCLMIGVPACAGCGGLITPSGTPGNILIIELLSTVGIDLSFLQWILIFAPLALITILVCGIWVTKVFQPEKIEEEAMEVLNARLSEAGVFSLKEKKTIIIIVAMLVCWFLGTWVSALNVTVVAVIGMTCLFLPGVSVLTWDDVAKRTNWNLVFTIGSVGVLISGMTATGIMDWIIGKAFSGITSWNVIAMFFVIGIIVCVIRAFIPTAPAIVALFGAPLLSLAAISTASPLALLIVPAYWACTPMLLWFEPIFLFSYGYGFYKPQDVLKYGSVPSVIMILLMSLTPYYIQLFGV